MVATPGTIPALPQYQPGQLPLAGTEAIEIVNTTNAAAAASYLMFLTDVVGKVPSVLPKANPAANDFFAFTQAATGLPKACSLAAFGVPSGNVAPGGTAGQVYVKNSATNFDANFTTLVPFLTLSTALISGIASVGGLSVGTVATAAGLFVTNGTVTNLVVANLTVPTQATIANLGVTNLTATNATVTALTVTNLTAGIATVSTAIIGTASIAALTITNLTVTTATATNLSATNATIGTILGTATIGTTTLGGPLNVSGGPGTPGQLLQSRGSATNPIWATGMVLLNTLSPNGVASTNDTSSLTTTYRNYMVTFENVCPAVNTAVLEMTVATSGSNFVSGIYYSLAQVNVTLTLVTDVSTTVVLLSGTRSTTAVATTALSGVTGSITLMNPANGVNNKQVNGMLSYQSVASTVLGTTSMALEHISSLVSMSTALTGVNFLFNTGNIATGTIRIYGF